MKLSEYVVRSDDYSMRIYPIGDMHLTLRSFDDARFRKYVKTIQDDPSGVAIIMGDVSDARSRDHKFFAPEMVHPRYRVEDIDIIEDLAAGEAADLLAPIADKLAGIIRGNHHQAGFTHSLRRELRHKTDVNVPDLGDRAMIRVKLHPTDRQYAALSYVVFATHKASAGQMKGAQINRQHRRAATWVADLYLDAHSHDSSQDQMPRYTLATRGSLRPVRRDMTFVNAGSWLKPVLFDANSYVDAQDLRPGSDVKYYVEVVYRTRGAEVVTTVKTWAG